MLLLAKNGKLDGCLIEGMGCPGGCIAGAGTNIQVNQAKKHLATFVNNTDVKVPNKELKDIEFF